MNDKRLLNMLKCFSLDMINVKKYGNPYYCVSAAGAIYTLFSKYISINTNDVKWIDRDRFVCTNASISPLLYSNIYLAGYDGINFDMVKNYSFPLIADINVNGIDLNPSNLSFSTAVGFALSESYLSSKYNESRKSIAQKSIEIFNYYTYVLTTPMELMSGEFYEAASFASSMKLGKLIVLYIATDIMNENNTSDVFNDNVLKEYEAIGWHVQSVTSCDDISAIDRCISKAQGISDKPSIIEIKAPYQNAFFDKKLHNTYLTEEDTIMFKKSLGVKELPFVISEEGIDEYRKNIYNRSSKKYSMWASDYSAYLNKSEKMLVAELECLMTRGLKYDIISMYKDKFNSGYKDNLSVSNGEIIQHIAYNMPYMIGLSLDNGISTHVLVPNQQIYSQQKRTGRNILYGVRKSSVGAVANGLALSGLRPFIGASLNDTSYLIPSIKQSSIYNLPTIYVLIRDSIRDNKNTYSVDDISMLRSIPNLNIFIPNDVNELVGVWDLILKYTNRPSVLIVSNEETYMLNTTNPNSVFGGAYVIRNEQDMLDGIIVASGIYTHLAISIANRLQEKYGMDIRVVSVPDADLFDYQNDDYRKQVLPSGVRTVVLELASKVGLEKYASGEEFVITLDSYLPSSNRDKYLESIGLDYQNIEIKVYELFK